MSAVLESREEPGRWLSVVLAVAVHMLLAGLLIYGVRWQTRPAAPVEVELVRAAPAPEPPAPAPAPEPPKAEPKPEPKVEAKPAPPKPDIAFKEKPKPKPEPKPVPKEAPQPKADPFAEQLRREAEQLAQRREAEKAQQDLETLFKKQSADRRAAAQAQWGEKIKGKIKPNIVVPPGVTGNPEAVFVVRLLPDASVFDVRLRKSSGNKALDEAIDRAIWKSSPLPKPDAQTQLERELTLTFRPLEN